MSFALADSYFSICLLQQLRGRIDLVGFANGRSGHLRALLGWRQKCTSVIMVTLLAVSEGAL